MLIFVNTNIRLFICSLFFLVLTYGFSTPAWSQHWQNDVAHCTVTVAGTDFFGVWQDFNLTYRAIMDSSSIIYGCTTCKREEGIYVEEHSNNCPVKHLYSCSVISKNNGRGEFTSIRHIEQVYFPPIFTTQENACQKIFKQANIKYQ